MPRLLPSPAAWKLLAAMVLGAAFPAAASSPRATLVMFEARGCVWCERWHEEIGPVYPKTAEGVRAPLRRVDLDEGRPGELHHLAPITYTPTFVLLHDGREVGRILGYAGEDFFWGFLEQLVAKLPEAAPQASAGAAR